MSGARGALELRPGWQAKLSEIISLLEPEVSVLRLAYNDVTAERRLAVKRAALIRRTIADLWKARPRRYRLEIETPG
ncbi:hypothetical protein [Chelativorans salis]|uniref:Uncharacterized protein n=1 Tax=Chelativorans salis TaxID=2978478 RepID=A0ABT2LP02_9HYPH|nr:hypothetical protein [Chelativorans sp. EGI FJ00035]MCT7375779.1 hypothetical protein [Chelativorans sp. EGI FJ00035]